MKPTNTSHVLDSQELFATLDELRVDAGLSWNQVCAEVGVRHDAFKRLRDGGTVTVDVLVSMLKWAEIEDLSDYIVTREEAENLGEDVDQVCIVGSPSDKIGR